MRILVFLSVALVGACVHAEGLTSVEQLPACGAQPLNLQTECPPVPTGHCYASVDVIPTQLRLTGRWDGQSGFAQRVKTGYEGTNGFGVRGQWWGFENEGGDSGAPMKDTGDLIDLDLYKAFCLDTTRFVVGAGPRYATFSLGIGNLGADSRFSGEGMDVFAEARHPTKLGDFGEFAVVARARSSLVMGNWNDNTNVLVHPTSDETISILELSAGVELREKLWSDSSWFVAVTPEIQRWDSAWMTHNLNSSIGVLGLDLSTGIVW
jgi:hypothetical protein